MPAEDGGRAREPRRRGPRRAVGGTATGAEPRLPALDGPRADEESLRPAGDDAHEEWLRDQRPPHWG